MNAELHYFPRNTALPGLFSLNSWFTQLAVLSWHGRLIGDGTLSSLYPDVCTGLDELERQVPCVCLYLMCAPVWIRERDW